MQREARWPGTYTVILGACEILQMKRGPLWAYQPASQKRGMGVVGPSPLCASLLCARLGAIPLLNLSGRRRHNAAEGPQISHNRPLVSIMGHCEEVGSLGE